MPEPILGREHLGFPKEAVAHPRWRETCTGPEAAEGSLRDREATVQTAQ